MKLFLAPMDGYTDRAFRVLVREMNPDVRLVTELTSAEALVYKSKKSWDRVTLGENEKDCEVQIFSKEPEMMRKAAALLKKSGVTKININFGCPAKRVVASGHGSALLRDHDLAMRLVEATCSAGLPVTVKTRLGWANDDEIFDFAPKMVRAGASAIYVHGRTVKDGFSGEARWENIYKLKEMLDVPVVGNGDVRSFAEAEQKCGNLDGVMIGRAAFGNPWVFKVFNDPKMSSSEFLQCDQREYPENIGGSSFKMQQMTHQNFQPAAEISWDERVRVMLKHAEMAEREAGARGIIELRKHLAAYVRGVEGAGKMRQKLVMVSDLGEVREILMHKI